MENRINIFGNHWLEVVFEGRNQMYGAYALRKQSNDFLAKAMLGMFLVFIVFSISFYLSATFDTKLLKAEPLISKPINPEGLLDVKKMIFEYAPPQVGGMAKSLENEILKIVKSHLVEPIKTKEITHPGDQPNVSNGNTNLQNPANFIPGTNKPNGISSGETSISDWVEKMPEFKGGFEALQKYISEHLQYPSLARENGISGRVMLKFMVDVDGSIKQVSLMNTHPIGWGCDEEAIRVITSMPAWQAGEQNGKKVPVFYVMPIIFSLN